jgi:hypothetical protein
MSRNLSPPCHDFATGSRNRVPCSVGFLVLGVFAMAWLNPVTRPAVFGQEADLKGPLEFCPGLELAASWDEASEKALTEGKLVLLIPSSTKLRLEEGEFGPGIETFRADALADSRVVNLIKRRFVPLLFDLSSNSSHYDEKATEMLFRSIPEMKLSTAMPTAPMLVVSSDGTEKAKVNIFLSTTEMLSSLAGVIAPEGKPAPLLRSETGLDSLEKANVFYEIRQMDRALELIKEDSSPEASLLRGKIACETRDWPAMKAAFSQIPDDRFAEEIEMCEVARSWEIGNYEGIINRVEEIRKNVASFPRAAEAMWYGGVAHYHNGNESAALEMWEQTVRAFPGTLWGMKADRTRGLVKHGLNKPLLMNRQPESLLGKRYLSPFGVHELKPR